MKQTPYNWNLTKQDKLKDWSKTILESHGNCWQYAIAAVLQLTPSEVPDFLGVAIEEGGDMNEHTQRWLNERGHMLINVGLRWSLVYSKDTGFTLPWLACGPTPRSQRIGQLHVVVMEGWEMVYDPHPDNSGLTAITDSYLVLPIPHTEA